MSATKRKAELSAISQDLSREALGAASPSSERCLDLVRGLEARRSEITLEVLASTGLGKVLTKSVRAFRRNQRSCGDGSGEGWGAAISAAGELLAALKEAAAGEARRTAEEGKERAGKEAREEGLPRTVGAYKARLEGQRKDLYKNPPALPPSSIAVEGGTCPEPTRNKKTGELSFRAGADAGIAEMLKDFHPNRTPEEVLRAGAFGGTYFRPIVSAVTNVRYKAKDVLRNTVDPGWIEGLSVGQMITSATYRPSVNKYGVKCGGSLGMWESSGWISDADPYGWFQWYCRFYRGRRCSDDARQISRWLKSAGPKGRFRSQLCNKIVAAGKGAGDASVSPVVRQTLLHWGLEITAFVLARHRKRVGV